MEPATKTSITAMSGRDISRREQMCCLMETISTPFFLRSYSAGGGIDKELIDKDLLAQLISCRLWSVGMPAKTKLNVLSIVENI
jgi:hypothetical protein